METISSYLAHGEGKECVKCCETHFLNTEKTLVLRQIEVRIKFKEATLLGETGIGRRILGSPPK